MSPPEQADDLAARAAETVRGMIAEAEERAAGVVREAEAEAARIREQAEADARQVRDKGEADARAQIESAKRALDQLGGSLTAAVEEALPKRGESPSVSEAPVSPPDPAPSPDPEPVPQSEAAENGDAAERLVAMKLAVEGKDPAAIEGELVEKFGPGDRTALLREVVSRAGN